MQPARTRGHRSAPHTADVILDAWASDYPSCCEEAVAALVGTYAGTVRGVPTREQQVHLPPATDEALLLDLLDELVFTLDTSVLVPIGAAVRRAGDGGLDVAIRLIPRDRIESTGAVPKAISRSAFEFAAGPDRVTCRFLVDL